jgi:hypothetical protein
MLGGVGRSGSPGNGGIGSDSANEIVGSFAPGNGGRMFGMAGRDGMPGNGGIGSASENAGIGNLQSVTDQDHWTGEPPPDGVAVPVRIQTSTSEVTALAAAACVTCNVASAENPTEPGGGTATNAGAMPVPTVAAKAVNADSIPGTAFSAANAAARAPANVVAAALTVVDAGTIATA